MKYHSIICLLLLGLVVGCGNRHLGVQGTVVFSDNGEPIPRGTVIFRSPTFQAGGHIDEQGRFTMGSYSEKDGCPPGTYQVAVIGTSIDLDASGLSTYNPVDSKFDNPSTSGMEITIDKTMKNIEIKVDRNPSPNPKGK